jgi:hypothetical protein
MHYKPDWIVANDGQVDQKYLHDLERKFSASFAGNPFVHESTAFLPYRCLSYGCAAWSVTTSITFVNEFFEKLGIGRRIEKTKSE